MTSHLNLHNLFGNIDVYLFDQLLKGRFVTGMQVLDAGCGGGRNLVYFLNSGYQVFAVDREPEAIEYARLLVAQLAPHLPKENFRVENIERMSFGDASFDWVLSNAVLHFADNEEHWRQMVGEMWRVLKPGGILFARLASTVGIEHQIELIENNRYHLPDDSVRFLVSPQMLLTATNQLGGELLEPLKFVVVHNQRAMGVWCLQKQI